MFQQACEPQNVLLLFVMAMETIQATRVEILNTKSEQKSVHETSKARATAEEVQLAVV